MSIGPTDAARNLFTKRYDTDHIGDEIKITKFSLKRHRIFAPTQKKFVAKMRHIRKCDV